MKINRAVSKEDLEDFYDRELTIELLLHRCGNIKKIGLTDAVIEIIIPDEKKEEEVDFTDEDIPF